ncbi:MAG: integrase core domain-containing protein, partial [Acidimicrobiaceae bacterium]|nr:integrase core domain-containing protein [Acidimicrobiaceae bacterium]
APPGRRPRKMLTAEQKYDLWVRMLTGQITQAEAAAEAGVDRSVISRLRGVARDGAVAALGASRPGRPRQTRAEASEAAALRAEAGAAGPHGGRAGRGAGGAAGKVGLGMSGPVPARVDGAAKTVLLGLIGDATAAGWTHGPVCSVLGIDRRRAWRWPRRRDAGKLDDVRPGGRPVHGLLGWERDEIVKLFDEWGDVDRSHRKLAHRGSWLGRVWVSPSTVDRVLAGHGLALAQTPRPKRAERTQWPDWCEWRPNQLWCWDGTQFPACGAAKHAYAVVDVVSRKWIATHLTATPDSVAARVLFARALDSEGLLSDEIAARLADPDAELPDDNDIPLLLALSDNGPEMRAGDTARFMAVCSIVQHFGRPSTPTDQAQIESLFAHVKDEHPHLGALDRPADLARELERVRAHYNSVRLHEGIGYVTPDDEHHGRGEQIRQARRDGLRHADAQRRHTHRNRPLP